MEAKRARAAVRPVYSIDGGESRRIQIAKVWLTVMVIFWHSNRTEVRFAGGDIVLQAPLWLDEIRYLISHVIVRCSVPGFFFLAGILLFRREFKWADNMKKKLRTLVAPYLILNTFWIAFYFVGQGIPKLSPFFANQSKMIRNWELSDYLGAYLGTILNSGGTDYYPMLAPLWFVRDLFVLNAIAPALKWVIDRLPKLAFLLLTAMLVCNISTGIFCLSATALAYFCFGYYMVKYGVHLSDVDRAPAPLLAGAYAALLAVNCLLRDWPLKHLVMTLTIAVGFAALFRFATKFSSEAVERKLLWLAKYSFPIYLFHEPSLGILQKLSAKFLPATATVQALTYFLSPVVIFFGCALFSALLERLFPRLYGVLTGGRKPPEQAASAQ